MKNLSHFHFLAFIILTALLACNSHDETPFPAPNPIEEKSKTEWTPLEPLSGDLETDLDRIEQLAEIMHEEPAQKKGKIVFLNANSNDELASKVAAAGPGGIVIIKPGNHYETGVVTITHKIKIIGMPGSVIHSGVQNLTVSPTVEPAIHLLDADHSLIAGLSFLPSSGGQDGGTAILIEDSKHVVAAFNVMAGFQFGIVLQESDHNKILGNEITVSDIGLSQFIDAHGIIVINGNQAKIRWNEVTNGLFGVWACDKNGLYKDNYTHHNFIGLILCNVPVAIPMPSGVVVGSVEPANNWLATKNVSSDNFNIGYLVIDGANNNTLSNNQASGNADYDVELTTDSQRFGFLTPASYENTVNTGPFNLLIKDCGNNNTVNGGTLVDITIDPCN